MSIQILEEATEEPSLVKESASNLLDVPKSKTTDEPTTQNAARLICGICTSKQSLYRCSRCYIAFCSLACSNVHKISHPAQDSTNSPAEPHLKSVVSETIYKKQAYEPFAPLEKSKDLQMLFKMYPNLPNVLGKIHDASLPPNTVSQSSVYNGNLRKKNEPQWTSDVGLQKGVRALQAARRSGDLDGEGVRAYAQLVLNLIYGSTEQEVVDQIHREIAQQDTKIIENLLLRKI